MCTFIDNLAQEIVVTWSTFQNSTEGAIVEYAPRSTFRNDSASTIEIHYNRAYGQTSLFKDDGPLQREQFIHRVKYSAGIYRLNHLIDFHLIESSSILYYYHRLF